MEKVIKEFTENIGATRIQDLQVDGRIRDVLRQMFKRPHYFIADGNVLIVKVSRSPKPFYGLGKQYVDIFNELGSNFFVVLLESANSGWFFSKVEINRNIKNAVWGLSKTDYKINFNTLKNKNRFNSCESFLLTNKEFENLKSQIVTSSWGGIRRAMPYAFTEQGVAMLSSVLKSKRAVQVNIEIMRAFVRLRKILEAHKDMAKRLEKLELQVDVVINVLDDLINPKEKKPQIGFRTSGK